MKASLHVGQRARPGGGQGYDFWRAHWFSMAFHSFSLISVDCLFISWSFTDFPLFSMILRSLNASLHVGQRARPGGGQGYAFRRLHWLSMISIGNLCAVACNWSAVACNWAAVAFNWSEVAFNWSAVAFNWSAVACNWSAVAFNWSEVGFN